MAPPTRVTSATYGTTPASAAPSTPAVAALAGDCIVRSPRPVRRAEPSTSTSRSERASRACPFPSSPVVGDVASSANSSRTAANAVVNPRGAPLASAAPRAGIHLRSASSPTMASPTKRGLTIADSSVAAPRRRGKADNAESRGRRDAAGRDAATPSRTRPPLRRRRARTRGGRARHRRDTSRRRVAVRATRHEPRATVHRAARGAPRPPPPAALGGSGAARSNGRRTGRPAAGETCLRRTADEEDERLRWGKQRRRRRLRGRAAANATPRGPGDDRSRPQHRRCARADAGAGGRSPSLVGGGGASSDGARLVWTSCHRAVGGRRPRRRRR